MEALIFCWTSSTKTTQIAPAHVGRHDDAPLAVLAADLVGSWREVETGHGRKRDERGHCATLAAVGCHLTDAARVGLATVGQGNGETFDGFQIRAFAFRQADHQVEALVTLVHRARRLPAERDLNDLLHVGHVEAVARHCRTVEFDREHGRPPTAS